MTTIYRAIGKFMFRYWLVKYRRQIRIGAGVARRLRSAATRSPPGSLPRAE
jgi:hypothetical protein